MAAKQPHVLRDRLDWRVDHRGDELDCVAGPVGPFGDVSRVVQDDKLIEAEGLDKGHAGRWLSGGGAFGNAFDGDRSLDDRLAG